MLNRSRTLAILGIAALAMGACEEKLTGGNACPSLCTEQQLGFKDTVFLASDVIDTMLTLPGIPSIGTETTILLARFASGGDSVVSAAVFRFDSVVRVYSPTDTTKPLIPFTSVDSSYVQLQVLSPAAALDTVLIQDTVTFIAYDVYANVPYLDTGVVHAKFSGTPIGTLTLPRDSITGQNIKIPIDTAWLTARVTSGTPVNIGVIVTSKKNVQMEITSAEGSATGGFAGFLAYVGSVDTLRQGVHVVLNAQVDNFGPPILAMQDYQFSFKGTAPYPAGVLAVGGLPSNRVLIKFKFPAWLIDSTTTVVRADLIMYQQAFSQFRVDSDSVFMNALPVVAAPAVTDFSKVGVLVGDASVVTLKTSVLPPFGTGADTLPLVRQGVSPTGALVSMFTLWKILGDKTQRGIVLALVGEGLEPRELWFYGTSAAPAQRPRVHVSYVPHAVIGLP